MRKARLPVGLLGAIALLAAPASAVADERFAEVGGDGPEPCLETNPCDIRVAVEAAVFQDDVTLAPGVYSLGSNSLFIPDGVSVGGARRSPVPVILAGSDTRAVEGGNAGGTTLHDLQVTGAGSYGVAGVETIDRVQVFGTGPTVGACAPYDGGLLRNSVCVATNAGGSNGISLAVGCSSDLEPARVVNVTAIGSGEAGAGIQVLSGLTCGVTLTGRNVIAQGDEEDIVADAEAGGSVTVNLRSSDYANVDAGSTGDITVTPPGSGSNITGEPAFVNPLAGNYRQLAASPTINAGRAYPNMGPFDFKGAARVQRGVPDIGAEEFEYDPRVKITRPRGRTVETTRGAARVRFRFRADESPVDLECRVDTGPWHTCDSPERVRLSAGDGRGDRHTFNVRATDEFLHTGPVKTKRVHVKRV